MRLVTLSVLLCGPVWAIAQPPKIQEITATWADEARDRDVPVKIYLPPGDGPFPVVIHSHGLGGSRDGYGYLGQHWAANGYVCVHPQHAGSDDGVWKDVPAAGRMAAMRKASQNIKNALDRPKDVTFVIDRLEVLNKTPESPLRGKLDLSKLGVSGHSFGAFTTLAAGGQAFVPPIGKPRSFGDPRVKAIIPMSAPVTKRGREEAYAAIKVPSLHMTGTKDDSPIGDTAASERRIPFDLSVNSERYLVTYTGGDHMIFSGRARGLGGDGSKDAEFQKSIRQITLAFWDAYLKGDEKSKARFTSGQIGKRLGKLGKFEQWPAKK